MAGSRCMCLGHLNVEEEQRVSLPAQPYTFSMSASPCAGDTCRPCRGSLGRRRRSVQRRLDRGRRIGALPLAHGVVSFVSICSMGYSPNTPMRFESGLP
jgi:hypothetical protein